MNFFLVYTHTEDCDESINGRYLKTRNTCEVTSSKESNVKEDHLQTEQYLKHINTSF